MTVTPQQVPAPGESGTAGAGCPARCASRLVGVNKSTGALYFHRLREMIALKLEAGADDVFGGEIEVDESDFGGRRKWVARTGLSG